MIDWAVLAARLGDHVAGTAQAVRATELAGGDINRAFCLQVGARRFFVKLNRAEREAMFVAERRGLEAIRRSGTIRVPEVYLDGRDGAWAYLVMEFIELVGQPDPGRLAQALAAMHHCVQARFGFDADNTIGSSAQANPLTDDWIEFWRESRLGRQLQLAQKNGMERRMIDSGYRLGENLAPFFSDYHPRASLLHGDLWSGNQGADATGNPVIYDPACYYGDHETDLAMMELFASPGERFFAVYHQHFPIDGGYRQRRDLYNLYHVLNHANLFGGGYPRQAQRMIDRLLAELR